MWPVCWVVVLGFTTVALSQFSIKEASMIFKEQDEERLKTIFAPTPKNPWKARDHFFRTLASPLANACENMKLIGEPLRLKCP